MKLKVKKVSVPHLNGLIKRMLLMDAALYINIDKTNVWSSVYVPTKDVVKSFSIPTSEIFEFESQPEETIKFSFFSGQKLASVISHFDPHHLTIDVSTYKEDAENVYYADKITLKDQKLKIDIFCQDISLGFTSMTDEQVKRAFDTTTEVFNFMFSREDFAKVASLMTLDKSELFKITQESDGVHIKTEAFDIIVDDSKRSQSTVEKTTFKSFLEKVDKETYAIHVCENKLILASQESNTRMALNLAITE